MRIVDKLLLALYSLIVGVCAVMVALVGFNVIPSESTDNYVYHVYNTSVVQNSAIVISILLVLISIRFLAVSLKRTSARKPSIDQKTDFGDIRISLDTVENLSLKSAGRIKGIHDVKARVSVNASGLEISVKAMVDGDASIPQLTEEVQRSVKSGVEQITGIPVAEVSVYIANIVQNHTFKSRVE